MLSPQLNQISYPEIPYQSISDNNTTAPPNSMTIHMKRVRSTSVMSRAT